MGSLEGKVAWVSGGSGGIGSATLRRFVAEGAAVVCSDIDDVGGEKLVAEFSARPFGCMSVHPALPRGTNVL